MTEQEFGLERFVTAQAPVIGQVRAELEAGQKSSHWMWFVFPQIAGLGFSTMSQTYAIGGREEAAAYLAHPVLGPRLRDCTGLVLAHQDRTAARIFGPVDAQKFCSCMTLFDAVAPDQKFGEALAVFFAGRRDRKTLEKL